MYCPNCGKDAGESKFCPECGAKISDGTEVSANGITGEKEQTPETTPVNQNQDYYEALKKIEDEKKQAEISEKKKAKKKKAIGCSVVLAIIAIIVAVIFIVPMFSSTETNNNSNNVEEEKNLVELRADSISLFRETRQENSNGQSDIIIADFDLFLKNISGKDIEKIGLTFTLYNNEGVAKSNTTYEFEMVVPNGEEVELTPLQWNYSTLFTVSIAQQKVYGMKFPDVFVGPGLSVLEPVADYKTVSVSKITIKYSDETTETQEGKYSIENVYYTGVFEGTFYYIDYPDKDKKAITQKEMPFEDYMKLSKDDEILHRIPLLPSMVGSTKAE